MRENTAAGRRGVARVLAPMLVDERPPLRRAPHAALLALVAGAWFAGLFEPAELALMELRMRAAERAPSGEVVVVEADGASPARLATLLDQALAAGARQVAFSHPAAPDAAFAAALARAGDRVVLAAREGASAAAGPRRAAVAPAADADGQVRRFAFWSQLAGESIPALPVALLGPAAAGAPAAPLLDFSIRAWALPRLGLDGPFSALAGKDVIVSAARPGEALPSTAQGRLPRADLLALGYETVAQKRWLVRTGALETLGIAAALALLLGPRFARLSWRRGLLLACAAPTALLTASLYAQAGWAVSLDLTPWLLLPLLGLAWEQLAASRNPRAQAPAKPARGQLAG